MVDMYFEFTDLCTTIPPLEYGGNEVLLEFFASKVLKATLTPHVCQPSGAENIFHGRPAS